MVKESTKEKILGAGAQIIHHKGYNHTGIQEVLKAAGVPKGSFYFYFKSKEDFGLQVIDYFTSFFCEQTDKLFTDQSIPPLERLQQVFTGFIELFKSFDYTRGCPIGNLAQEMGDLSPAFRQKLNESVHIMIDLYEQLLKEAQQTGDISNILDCREMADFIVSSWHGALVRMKIEKSSGPLKNHQRFMLEMLKRQ